MQTSPAGKSRGDLEGKHEHSTHSGGSEKNADEGPSLQTLPVNATSTRRGRSEKKVAAADLHNWRTVSREGQEPWELAAG